MKELVAMIRTQRSFELNSEAIKAADQNLQVINGLKR
jgi:flagellar basal body rod protein FlgG